MANDHSIYISRHVVSQADTELQPVQPIETFREHEAYVLLGEPGSGKTTLFKKEAEILGDGARYTTVRDFLRSDLEDADRRRVLFIDAMDEQRAAEGLVQQPLDRLIAKLKQLGRPRFRLSCRAADWHHLDTKELEAVAGDGRIRELQLHPLTEAEIERLLESWTPNLLSDPQEFMERARQNGLESMLGNPMLLQLLAHAVSGDAWPASRTEIFQLACKRLAEEHNENHERLAEIVNIDELLDDAGMLCAVLLLSDRSTYRTLGRDDVSVHVKDLPTHFTISPARIKRALNTPLFVSAGAERWYRHRSIAEFLAARSLVWRLENGLPTTRVLALMGGTVGGIVDALRGLYAWLVSFSGYRDILIQHDVLAVVYYGDVRDFSTETKCLVFETIYRSALQQPGLGRRDWQSKAFGALGTPDMELYFSGVLTRNQFEDADEVLLLSVLEAIEHGRPMPRLFPAIVQIAEDDRHWEVVRQAAVEVLMAQSTPQGPYLMPLLSSIRDGAVNDADDELAGRLLSLLYPSMISTNVLVSEFLKQPKRSNFLGSYRNFWQLELWNKVPEGDAVVLADSISETIANGTTWPPGLGLNDLYHGAILRAAEALGSQLTGPQLDRWISAGLDSHGYRKREGSRALELSQWLAEHPDQLKAVYEYGLVRLDAHGKASQYWGWQHTLLEGRQVPSGWYDWLLEVAGRRDEKSIVQHCFSAAAWAAAHISEHFPDGLEKVYAWLRVHGSRWSSADVWREAESWLPLDDWRREERIGQNERAAQIASDQAQRREALGPQLASLLEGGISPGLMHDILAVMERGVYGVEGETPLLRVQSYLVCDASTAQRAINSLDNVLDHGDLPPWEKVIELDANKEMFLIQPVCLYAASRSWKDVEDDGDIANHPGALTLLAFALMVGRKPSWFDALVKSQPAQVASVMKAFLTHALQGRRHHLSTVRWLDYCPLRSPVPAEVLDSLLTKIVSPFGDDFPRDPMGTVLQYAIKYCSPVELKKWVEATLSVSQETVPERTVALTVSLAYTDALFDELLANLAGSQARAALCCAVFEQSEPRTILSRLTISFLGRLVEELGRIVAPRSDMVFSIREDDRIRSGVTVLLAELASRSVRTATQELVRLRKKTELKQWVYKITDFQMQSEQRVRDSLFSQVDPLKVVEVLSNREPATERDLVAFVLDHVDTLMRRIRFGGTNMLGIFWREDKGGKRIPHTENVCRDRFLHLLNREMEPMGIHIGKEQPTARDKRSDMMISLTRPGRHMSVPVEVKLDNHPNVWHAWETQLMRLYAPDPDSGFHGVYLVMFAGYKTKPSPHRLRPASAEEMAQQFSELIPSSYHGRLHGMVLDLSVV